MLFTTFLLPALAMSTTVSELELQLQSPDSAARRTAAEKLCRLGTEARAAAVSLVKATGDADDQTRQWASAALEELGPPDEAATPTLMALLDSLETPEDCAYWAVTLLGRMETEQASCVEPLARAAQRHYSLSVRERAVWALGKMGPNAESAEPVLTELAASGQPRLARLAKTALSQIQSAAD